jgi:hypothetical protein
MSTSSGRASGTAVSVVIGSNGAAGSVEACLAALEPQAEDVDVIVCEPEASGEAVRRRYPLARFVERKGALVPTLWTDGVEASSGDVVCLTISPMRPAEDWLATARRLSAEAAVVGGAVEPGEGLRTRDWAEYFCRYARDMLPFEPRESSDLPGDNSVYSRAALDRVRDVYREGFWEPDVNRAIRDLGERLLHSPELVVSQGRSNGFWAFMRQRLVHGRAYGRQRGRRFSAGRNIAGVALAVLVPFVLLARTSREVLSRKRLRTRLLLALPALAAYDVAWALGEAAGHLDSLRGR